MLLCPRRPTMKLKWRRLLISPFYTVFHLCLVGIWWINSLRFVFFYLAYCEKEGVPKPSFFHELVEEEPGGSKKFKVWAEKESQRFELQTLFRTIEEGQERLAKRVLLREQKLATKQEAIWTKRYIRIYIKFTEVFSDLLPTSFVLPFRFESLLLQKVIVLDEAACFQRVENITQVL